MKILRHDVAWSQILFIGMLCIAMSAHMSYAQTTPPALIDANAYASTYRYTQALPNPLDPSFIYQPSTNGNGCDSVYNIGHYQKGVDILGLTDMGGSPVLTEVFAYGTSSTEATYPGKTFVAQKDENVCVNWENHLPNMTLPWVPVDTTIHWAGSTVDMPDLITQKGVPIVPHLHGGHTEWQSDGLPEAWWTAGDESERMEGRYFVKTNYFYDNSQEAATLWYHDHTLGMTRTNVYSGLAGFYILRDDWDTGGPDNGPGLPYGEYEIPLAIQDRMFTEEGQLFYPSTPEMAMGGHEVPPVMPDPSVLPEFFGDFILVNGKPWPKLDVEARTYRFRILNGSDSRFYNLWLTDENGTALGPSLYQIGTDSGLLEKPVRLLKLALGPGERADVLVDFGGFEGQRLILRNNARSPFPNGDMTVDPETTGQIMAFDVAAETASENPGIPYSLRQMPIPALGPAAATRRLLLAEGTDHFGRLQPLLGIIDFSNPLNGTLLWDDPVTENPMPGDTEVWEIYNTTPDAHPIHLHLVAFQILNRQRFAWTQIPKENIDPMDPAHITMGSEVTSLTLLGQPLLPPLNQRGRKDTVQILPGEVLRVKALFDRAGRYVWHCHILSHEDHEMMRPYYVGEIFGPTNPQMQD